MAKDALVLITTPSPGIAQISLNRPQKRNALNVELIQTLTSALEDIAVDRSIRVVLLTGEGDYFCSGADINVMQKMINYSYEENVADAQQLAHLLNTLHNFPKPTIALAQGPTFGGGLGLIACCDIAIVSENAYFCFSEVKIGLTPSVISPYIISAIGPHSARYYFLTAEKFDANEGKRIGLVHQVVTEDQLAHTGLALAQKLLKNAPQALTEVKNLISTVTGVEITEELVQFTAEHLAAMRSTEEAQEGLKSFLERREAQWK